MVEFVLSHFLYFQWPGHSIAGLPSTVLTASYAALAEEDCSSILGMRSKNSYKFWKPKDEIIETIDQFIMNFKKSYQEFPSDEEYKQKFLARAENAGQSWSDTYAVYRDWEAKDETAKIRGLVDFLASSGGPTSGDRVKKYVQCLKSRVLAALRNLPENKSYPMDLAEIISTIDGAL
ncbi:MAG: hypothetical protein C5B49_09630 [Bdellovibrio sp.]|nr:MAG: hypothetical protein C5B49_09630 [Bdellovibrio sp.]